MVRLDIRYRNKLSFVFDFFIMLKTVPTILGMIIEPILNKLQKIKDCTTMNPMQTMKKRSIYLLITELFYRITYKK
jgi:hypothetical protein